MLKELFKTTRTKLKEVAELNWIDLDKGQMEDYDPEHGRPSVSFPAALITVQFPRTNSNEEIKGLKQRIEGMITVRICFDFTGNTSGATEDAQVDQSLAYLDIVQLVYEKLQGYTDGTFNKLDRISLRDERRPDKYKVINMIFKTEAMDNSALIAAEA